MRGWRCIADPHITTWQGDYGDYYLKVQTKKGDIILPLKSLILNYFKDFEVNKNGKKSINNAHDPQILSNKIKYEQEQERLKDVFKEI